MPTVRISRRVESKCSSCPLRELGCFQTTITLSLANRHVRRPRSHCRIPFSKCLTCGSYLNQVDAGMLFPQMFWVRRPVAVCVFEKSWRSMFRSEIRVMFLGRLHVLPLLFCRREWIFRDISDQHRLRSAMLSELDRIMCVANLNGTYHVVDWFLKKGRLFVHVSRETQKTKRASDLPWNRILSLVKRLFSRLR